MNQTAPLRAAFAALAGYEVGDRDERPWGAWEVLAVGLGYAVKRITVRPGQRLSLQYHEFRCEHWTVVAGRAEVEVAGETVVKDAGEHVFVPLRAPHRIRNIGASALTFVEVQTGEILDEADIVRLGDDYGRA